MKTKELPKTVRRSVALARALAEEVMTVSLPGERHNFNYLVTVALRTLIDQRRAQEFEQAMARMAADPQIRRVTATINREFAAAEGDGL